MINTVVVVFLAFFLLFSLSNAIEVDFCVADYSLPRGPNGYSCKNPANVTTDDFIFTGFRGERIANNIRNNVTLAFSNVYPGLNGLSLGLARLDWAVNISTPVHSHRKSELMIVTRGSIIAGIIDSNNTAYYRRLEVGDVIVYPKYLLHFQINAGDIQATAFVMYEGANPGIQTVPAFMGSNLPTNIVEQITLVSAEEIERLKRIFGNA